MSRRKQLRPRHIQTDDLCVSTFTEDVSVGPAVDHCALVCSRCCAEFSAPSDLEQHQRGCSPNPPVLIVNEDEDLLSGSNISPASLPASPAGEPSEMLFEMETVNTSQDRSCKTAEFIDCFSSRRSRRGAGSPESSSSHRSISGPDWRTDTALCTSVFPQSLPQPGCSAEREGCLWMKSNAIVENLESTKVAVAQLSQLMRSDSCHSKTTISSLLQQLLALQIQQIHQLQLIDQIRHQVMLFASQQAEIPETLVIYAKDLPSSKSTNQLKTLSVHLSQQLAAAAGLAKCLSTQSAHMTDFKHFTATEKLNKGQSDCSDVLSGSESSQTFSKSTITAVNEHVSNKQHMDCGSSDSRFNFFSKTKMSSLKFSNNTFTSKTSENSHLPQPSSSDEHAASNPIPNISEIVEDLDSLAALAHQRKCNNLQLSTPTLSSKESLFKVKCRFCTQVFGSNSALQIHLLSHTGDRPYKCNICGNRFSTRGNLKVHFQRHKEKYPHIQLNPHLVPEHLDNIQTGDGIPLVMSLLPEKAAAGCFDRSPSSTTMTSGSLDSNNLSSLIKTEDDLVSVPTPLAQGDLCFNSAASMDLRSKVNPAKTPESVETRKQRTMNIKSEDVKPSFNIVSTMTSEPEESVSVIPNPTSLLNSTSFSGFLSLKHSNTSKLQLPSAITDKRSSDPNECVICHRTLSCQSALRMHFRTHTGERPYQCKLCGRAFTTKGNLKTHQAVHRATVPLRVQHSCPICQRKFTNAVVFQQHVHMHVDTHLHGAHFTAHKYSGDCNEGFRDKAEVNQRKNFSDDNGDFCDNRCPRLKSLSIRLSSPLFSKNQIDAKKKTRGPHGELQLRWIKTERPEGSNEECSQTNNQRAAESGQQTFPMSNSPASDRSLSPHGRASVYFNTAGFDEPLQTWLDSTSLTLKTSAAAPTCLKLFTHSEDSPILMHNLRGKGFLKNTYCDLCGKNFACQSALDIHYRSHTKERPFICTACSRGFSTKGNLKQHMLTHRMRDFPPHLFEPSSPSQAPNPNVSRLYVGSQAVKTEMTAFLNSSFSRSHSSSVSEFPVCAAAPPRRMAKQHHCQTCGKSFSSSSALQIHERTHTGERPFACAVCGRAFTTKGNLKVHMGTHMWNAPSRRGRRLCADRLLAGAGTRPVKLPELSQKNPATVSDSRESVWSRSPAGLKVNDVGVVRVQSSPASLMDEVNVQDLGEIMGYPLILLDPAGPCWILLDPAGPCWTLLDPPEPHGPRAVCTADADGTDSEYFYFTGAFQQQAELQEWR
ncbi:sal-like protein 1 [Chaetodon trifascialis]|uniref:sal-like protein 1 n=1 Tax=Chaetodon trifascialis TaxID=109706 RepID=UPI003993CD3A